MTKDSQPDTPFSPLGDWGLVMRGGADGGHLFSN
jgi:hypothetical protein